MSEKKVFRKMQRREIYVLMFANNLDEDELEPVEAYGTFEEADNAGKAMVEKADAENSDYETEIFSAYIVQEIFLIEPV